MKKILFVIGICILLYPSLSNLYNLKHQSQVIDTYEEEILNLDVDQNIVSANEYNEYLFHKNHRFYITKDELAWYSSLLNVNDGMMGHILIPKIKVSSAIYHGTSEDVLQVAIGHLEGSSLPVGGLNTHAVLLGHRGLPSARLFTDIDQLCIGDIFMINIFNQTLKYQVDLISIVPPNDYNPIQLEENKDYVSLITCTPYGVNTHRLIIRGSRIE